MLDQRDKALGGEEGAFRVDAELAVEGGFGDLVERREFGNAGIHVQEVDLAELVSDLVAKPGDRAQVGNVGADDVSVAAERAPRLVEGLFAAAGDQHFGAAGYQCLRDGEPHAMRAADNHCLLALVVAHDLSLFDPALPRCWNAVCGMVHAVSEPGVMTDS